MGDRIRAIQFYQQAQQIKEGKVPNANPAQAYQLLSTAVVTDPTFALGFYELGNANSDNLWRASAVAAIRRALELPDGTDGGDLTPEYRAKAISNLAHNLHHLGRNVEAKDLALKALKMDDKLANAWLTLSLIQNVQGNLGNAEISAARAMSLGRTPAIEIGLAFAQMYQGKYREGLAHFEARYEYVLRHFLDYPYPQWKGEAGKTVAVMTDQGMGDVISFARFLPALIERCAMVHIRVHPELVKLLKVQLQRFPNITIEPVPCPYPPADYWTTFMSIPTALDLSTDEIKHYPAMYCPEFRTDASWKSTDRDFHIAVTWTGSNANWINGHRSFQMEQLLELYRVPGIQLYSLQIDEGKPGDPSMRIHETGAATLIRDMRPYVRDVTDTMAILREMDLIICCESILGHIGGLMERETWIPYSYSGGDFRIGRNEDGALWYPKHRIFKQGSDQNWDLVFLRIQHALERKVAEKRKWQEKASTGGKFFPLTSSA